MLSNSQYATDRSTFFKGDMERGEEAAAARMTCWHQSVLNLDVESFSL